VIAGAAVAGALTGAQADLVSAAPDGTVGNGWSSAPAISYDGRLVVFYSYASNLVIGDDNNAADVVVRDRALGSSALADVSTQGTQSAGSFFLTGWPAIDGSGRFVAFTWGADDLVVDDTNGMMDVFVRDRWAGITERVNVGSDGAQADSYTINGPSINDGGRYVAFQSYASNLTAGDSPGTSDVFIRDRVRHTTVRVPVDHDGHASSWAGAPRISADGRYVVYVWSHTGSNADVYLYDTATASTVLVTSGMGGAPSNGGSAYPQISADGRYVAYWSSASNLVGDDTNGGADVFVWDRVLGQTMRASATPGGGEFPPLSVGYPSISADGGLIVFNTRDQIYVHEIANGITWGALQEPLSSIAGAIVGGNGKTIAFEDGGNVFVTGIETIAEQLAGLRAVIKTLDVNLGIAKSLDAKLATMNDALVSVRRADHPDLCAKLEAFDAEVDALAGRALNQAAAEQLLEASETIGRRLGCV
jgi:hypothetical protein